MALVLGSNCGFVSAAPVVNPSATAYPIVSTSNRRGQRHTSPTGSYKATQIGWWQDKIDNGENSWTCAIYSNDASPNPDEPNVALSPGVYTGNTVPANTAGWQTDTVNIPLASATSYWIFFAVGYEGNDCYSDCEAGVELTAYQGGTSTLPDTWSTRPTIQNGEYDIAVYALYEADVKATKNSRSNPLGTQHGMALRHQ